MPSMEAEATALAPARPPRPRGDRRLAIFDLDRTLLPGSSLAHLGLAAFRAGLLRRTRLSSYLVREALFARWGASEPTADRLRARLLADVAGQEREPLARLVESLGAELVAAIVPAARRLVDLHLEAGDYCVVLSASPQELVQAVAVGIGADLGVGSRVEVVDGRLTGRLDGPFCHGEGKLARLRDELGQCDLRRAWAYSDAASDLPLLSACGQPAAVNPDRRLRAAALASGWPVLGLQ